MRRTLAAGAVLLGAALAGCPDDQPQPGDVIIGSFAFETALTDDACQFEGRADPGAFSATVSIDSHTGKAFLTSSTVVLRGTLSEEKLDVVANAKRDLPAPCSCPGTIEERLEAATVRRNATGGAKSCEAFGALPDGGLEAGPDDAGRNPITLLCGTLTETFTTPEGASCSCEPCTVVYALSGKRQ